MNAQRSATRRLAPIFVLLAVATGLGTPADAQTVTYGYATAAPAAYVASPGTCLNLLLGQRVVVSAPVQVTALGMVILAAGGKSAKLGLYADNVGTPGQPGAFVAGTPITPLVDGVNEMPVSATLAAGTYWVTCSTANAIQVGTDGGAGNTLKYLTGYAVANPFPNPFDQSLAIQSFSAATFSLYIKGTAVSVTPTVTVTGVAPEPSGVGASATITADVVGASGTPTGTVQFVVDGANSGTPVTLSTINGTTGRATRAHTFPVAGTHTVTAAYSGDGTYGAANSGTYNHQVNGTPAGVGALMISQYALGASAGTTAEFVEVYNPGASAHVVGTNDGSAGYGIRSADNTLRATIPNGTSIPSHGFFLAAHQTGYSYGLYPAGTATTATADATWTGDIADGTGVALFNSATAFTGTQRVDSVGSTATGALYHEGAGLPSVSASSDYAWVRKLGSGLPQDTNDNISDFVLVDTANATVGGQNAMLGAPGPRNLSSPTLGRSGLASTVVDPGTATTLAPNRVRVATPVANGALGTLAFRMRFTNNTGAPVTRLRFRVIDISTRNSPSVYTPQAQLRVLSGVDNPSVTTVTYGAVAVKGATLETPPAQGLGGGYDSSVSVPLGGGLANGSSVNVEFLVGVEAKGNFSFFTNWEFLP